MIRFWLGLSSVHAVCNVFDIKCLDSEFAYDLTGEFIKESI